MDTREFDRATLGQRLRVAREYLQLSQEETSRALGISRAAISLIESGQRKVDAVELKRLAVLYQRSVAYFIGDVTTAKLPEDVEHLARTASALSEQDRRELARFAEFLQSRVPNGSQE